MKKGVVLKFAADDFRRFDLGVSKLSFVTQEPFSITAIDRRVDEDIVYCRLEADWLPDWTETEKGGKFPRAMLIRDARTSKVEVKQIVEIIGGL